MLTRDGFTIERTVRDYHTGQMAVMLGDGTMIYIDTPVAPRGLWIVEDADLPKGPKLVEQGSGKPRFRVVQTLQSPGNDPVTIPYGPPTSDLFEITHSMVAALAITRMEQDVPTGTILLRVEAIRMANDESL